MNVISDFNKRFDDNLSIINGKNHTEQQKIHAITCLACQILSCGCALICATSVILNLKAIITPYFILKHLACAVLSHDLYVFEKTLYDVNKNKFIINSNRYLLAAVNFLKDSNCKYTLKDFLVEDTFLLKKINHIFNLFKNQIN